MDREKIDAIFRLGIAAAILLVGLSVAYHYIIYIPERDARTERKVAAEQTALANNRIEREEKYKKCVSLVEQMYAQEWATACATQAQQTERRFESCIKLTIGSPEYCRNLTPKQSASPDCTLFASTADRLNQWMEENKNRCLKEAENGLR